MTLRTFLMCAWWAIEWAFVIVGQLFAGNDQIGPPRPWSGVRICVKDPELCWTQESDCVPCNCSVFDGKRYVAFPGSEWRMGIGEYAPDGKPNHIAVVKARDKDRDGKPQGTPYFQSVVRGEVVQEKTGYQPHAQPILGYRGPVDDIIELYPFGLKPRREGGVVLPQTRRP
jgi:hypothetical protein